jgi:biofilm protein TabA
MRLIADINQKDSEVKRLMIFDTGAGVYVFGYNTKEDSSGIWDDWYETIHDAFESCEEEYGIKKSDWTEIPDPMEYCQDDWINPVRIKGRDIGKPEWGKLEKLINGKWIEFSE